MQHHTKKITTILVFAIQEWILIILLLINSLFSYLIAKFIAYFGLKPPCLWCSGVGSFLDHHKDPNSYTSIFCEFHATEILKILGYCFDHRELAESQKMRNEFSFNGRSIELSPKITFCSWARKNKNENEKRKFERSSVTIEPHGPPAAKEDVGGETINDKMLENERTDQTEAQELVPHFPCMDEYQSSVDHILNRPEATITKSSRGLDRLHQKQIGKTAFIWIEEKQKGTDQLLQAYCNFHEVEEERLPNTPTFMDNKKSLPFEKKKRDSSVKELMEESVVTEMNGWDKLSRIERLKLALNAQRKALSNLYIELEQERSSSPVATNESMSMIRLLQEEKAALKMEALRYQRMMEEQSEYDQEALQLLNQLIIKREKEKQELTKELELHRSKVSEYESRDRMMFQMSSGSCSYGDNRLEKWLVEFEEERLSILDQVKVLEEKFYTLDVLDDEQQIFEDIKPTELFSDDKINCFHNNNELNDQEEAIGIKTEEESVYWAANCGLEKKRDVFEEEVDHVYERLEALEADGEFLNHCLGSIKKGDKGMDLLQEILQRLHDLRTLGVHVGDQK